jgi:hypothetical protein
LWRCRGRNSEQAEKAENSERVTGKNDPLRVLCSLC